MINSTYGNVLDVSKGIIVHGCNCQGVMGSGIALEVKNRFPEAFKVYRQQYEAGDAELGTVTFVEVSDDKFIVNALTQNLYGVDNANFADGRLTSYDAVSECFVKVAKLANHLNTHRADNGPFHVYFPKIGAVRGGGNWEIIKSIIDEMVPDSIAQKVYYEFIPPTGI